MVLVRQSLAQAEIETLRVRRAAPPVRVQESSPIHVDEDATEYEAMVGRHAWLLNWPFVEMLSRMGLRRGRVLDVGTGPGLIPVELARRNPGLEVWALDASENMLEQGRRRAERAGVGERVRFVRGDATDVPFEAGHFDLCTSHFMLHHIERPESLFDEMARVTRGGGRIVIKDLIRQPGWKRRFLLAFSRLALGYSPEQLRMYDESLGSALSVPEVRAALSRSRLSMARVRGFRGLDYVIES